MPQGPFFNKFMFWSKAETVRDNSAP